MTDGIVGRLSRIEGVVAVALGGSRARGTQRPDSDVDIGLYYRDSAPFSIDGVFALAEALSDEPNPVVTDFYRWGPWVNGGAWLTIKGQRVDFLYRSLDRLEQVIADCRQGRIESEFYQQAPYGFHSYIYLGELSVCKPLYDPQAALAELKARLIPYPPPLRKAIVDRFLWGVEFDLSQAVKLAERRDVYSTAGCLTRCAAGLVQVVYALNEHYFVSDKGALTEIESFSRQPVRFVSLLEQALAHPGTSASELSESVSRLSSLLREVAELAGDLYTRPEFRAGLSDA